ncbi:Retrotransposon gag domain [Sesbania bispinosa]|nr:Retrotransposon gag domain [Sesbania bispinosa]
MASDPSHRNKVSSAFQEATNIMCLSDALSNRDQLDAANSTRLDRLETSIGTITRALDSITLSVERLSQPQPHGSPHHPPPFHTRQVKLDFPKFDGTDPLHWLFRAEQFFSYYDTPDLQPLTIAGIHFEESVIPWFQMLHKSNLVPTWAALACAIEEQFGPSQFDSPRARLFKLTQTSTAEQYYTEFMVLANRVEGLSDAALLDCFVSGLKDSIRRDVIAQSPTSLLRAASLARLFDEKCSLGSSSHKPRPGFLVGPPKLSSMVPPSSVPHGVSRQPLLPTPTTKPIPPVKKMTSVELQLHREKGLCFTCDEKYTWNHKCPNRQYMLFLGDNDEFDSSPQLDATIEP